MNCREAREYLPAYSEEPFTVPVDARKHVSTCSACRGELEEYRLMTADLAALERAPVEEPAWLETSLVETVGEAARVRAARKEAAGRAAAVAGGAIVAAGMAGAFLVSRRRRRRRGGRLRGLLSEA